MADRILWKDRDLGEKSFIMIMGTFFAAAIALFGYLGLQSILEGKPDWFQIGIVISFTLIAVSGIFSRRRRKNG